MSGGGSNVIVAEGVKLKRGNQYIVLAGCATNADNTVLTLAVEGGAGVKIVGGQAHSSTMRKPTA